MEEQRTVGQGPKQKRKRKIKLAFTNMIIFYAQIMSSTKNNVKIFSNIKRKNATFFRYLKPSNDLLLYLK